MARSRGESSRTSRAAASGRRRSRFFTVVDLVNLLEAEPGPAVRVTPRSIGSGANLVVLDEFDYLPLSTAFIGMDASGRNFVTSACH
jgi:hypothetical protein